MTSIAFTETCRRLDVPYAIERSRSGNGAHVWFFFSSPSCSNSEENGQLSDYGNNVQTTSTQHGVL